MTTATLDFKSAFDFTEKIARDAETGKIAEWPADQVAIVIQASTFLRDLFRSARDSIKVMLSQGVDAQAFAEKYDRAITDLDRISATVARVLLKCQSIPIREFTGTFQAMSDEVTSLRTFLEAAVTKARTSHVIDWNRVQQAQAAYSRGETKPWERSTPVRAIDR
jgi:hypothetical protein